MDFAYDDQNIFAKILRGEIPNNTVFEDDFALAFHDIAPQAPVHVLVIPKGAFVNFDDFATNGSDAQIADFNRAVSQVVAERGLAPKGEAGGYRLISNAGTDGVQEVPHFHVHVLGGRVLGSILQKA